MSRNPTWSQREATAAFLCALGCLALPVALVHWPPLLDYPNHYARMWLLSGGVHVYPLSTMYQVTWHNAFTNIGIDVIAFVAGRVLPIQLVAHSLVVAAVALPPLGAHCLNRRIFGGAHWWHVAFVILAWDYTLAAGFLNFQIGLGLALLGAAIDPVFSRRSKTARVAATLFFGALTLFVHAFAFVFYAALVAALAIGPTLEPTKSLRAVGRGMTRVAAACWPLLALLVLFLSLAPKLPGSEGSQVLIRWQDPGKLGYALATAFMTYRPVVDVLFAFGFALPVVIAAATRRLDTHTGLLLVATLFAILSNFMPAELGHTALIDKRLPPMAVFTFAAAVRPALPDSTRWQRGVLLLMWLAATARTAWVSRIWLARQSDFSSLERALKAIPSGAAVLPLQHGASAQERRWAPTGRYFLRNAPNYWQLPVLAVVERHAFVPTLFTAAGKQPIRVLPPWDEIAVPEGPLADVNQIVEPLAVRRFPYLADWRNRFDFVLVVNADIPNESGPMPSLPELRLISDQGFARLYEIKRHVKALPLGTE